MVDNKARIIGKITIDGLLKLQSPLLIASGEKPEDTADEVDKVVLRNHKDQPFIPGTSLAGVLRADVLGQNKEMGKLLFGYIEKDEGDQSAISIDDVTLENAEIIYRDGVGIDPFTHTAIAGRKYDYEAVERGAAGAFHAVVTLRALHEIHKAAIQELLGSLVSHMRSGFMVGALTTKGFGRVCVEDARAVVYDFHNREDVLHWLAEEETGQVLTGEKKQSPHAADTFAVDADFSLRSSLIIRDYDTDKKIGDSEISAVQKKSNGEFVIPGTSLKGVLRHQAERILRLMGKYDGMAGDLNDLMGYAEDKDHKEKSNFYVEEIYLTEGIKEKEQSRNRIDRFTGGTIESALFTTEPVWQEKPGTATVHLHYEIHHCLDWQAGLALFLLRDLWQGDVAIGGEKSIGRGTLQGISAAIDFQGKPYTLDKNGKVETGDWNELEQYAQALAGR